MPRENQPGPISISILRRPEVGRRTGLSRITIYLKVSQRTFPRPIKLGMRAVGWVAAEIDDWLQQQVAIRDRE